MMPDPGSRLSAFIAELRRRRVFRVAAFYGGIAFVITEIIGNTFSYLGIPDWFGTAIIVLLIVGFPVAMVLAWAFDITEEGIVRAKGKAPAQTGSPRPLIGNTALGIVASLAILVAAWSWFGAGDKSPEIRSIAVLPLVNLMNDPNQDYFVDGMTEALITDLSKISTLRVIGRTSTMSYKANPKPIPEIAAELNVDAVIEGSVLRAENRVRITAQLVASRPERHLWANSYERDLRDILALQGELARTIAMEIEIILTPEEEAQIDKKPTENLSAYEDYLNGRYYWAKRTREDTWKAVEFYEAAIAKDSTYALAYSGIADCYVVDAGRLLGVTVNESRLIARTFALRALELDSTLSEPHSVLAQILWYLDWDFSGADKEFIQALRLNPSDVTSLRRYAWGLVAMGRGEEAIQRISQAYRIDPLAFITNLDRSALLYLTRRYEEAIEQCLKTLKMAPDHFDPRYWLALSYQQKGMTAEAVAEFEKAGLSFEAQLARGNLEEARQILEDEIESEEPPPNNLTWIAMRNAALGEIDKAFEWLERSYDERSPWLSYLKVDPRLDVIRDDPRYTVLVEKMGLE